MKTNCHLITIHIVFYFLLISHTISYTLQVEKPIIIVSFVGNRKLTCM